MTGRHNLLLIASGMSLLLLAGCNQSGRPLADGTAGPAFTGEAPVMGVVEGSSYVVAPGDTVGAIAERTNTPVRTLIDLNHLLPPYRVQAGTRLLLQPRSNYVVRQGDTIQKVAQSQGVSQSALIQLNGLTAPYNLRPGQSLILPSGVEASSPTNVAVGQSFVMPQATPDGSSAPTTAPSGGVSKAALPPLTAAKSGATSTAANTASTASGAVQSAATAAPQTLAPATAAADTAKKIETQPMSAASTQAQAAQAQTAQTAASNLPPPKEPVLPPDPFFDEPASKANAASPATTQTAAKAPATTAATGNGQFGWPVQGNVVSKFGATADGLRNDGINIAAPAGSPVVAASDGVVAYAGNELRGFGNMVLIRHANGWVTAYAHNQSLTVKKGDQVKRGQTIARVGSTGNVQSPQLHFEIRKGTSAVDPMKYLGS